MNWFFGDTNMLTLLLGYVDDADYRSLACTTKAASKAAQATIAKRINIGSFSAEFSVLRAKPQLHGKVSFRHRGMLAATIVECNYRYGKLHGELRAEIKSIAGRTTFSETFVNGKLHGKIIVCQSGSVYELLMHEGMRVSAIRNGEPYPDDLWLLTTVEDCETCGCQQLEIARFCINGKCFNC